MRVFVIGARGFPGVQGGIERHCEELYCRLSEYKDLDITIIAIDKYRKDSSKTWKGIKFKCIKALNSKNLEKIYYGFKASIYTILKRPDIVHFQGLNSAIYIPLIKLFGIKVVFTQHSMDYKYPKWGILARRFLSLSERAALKADKIIAVSESINNHLKKYTDRSLVIHNGVDIEHPHISPEVEASFLNEYGLKKGGYIFFAGRFTPEKAIEDLINAFNELQATSRKLQVEGWKLVIAGDAEHETEYSKMIKDLAKKSTGIVLTGFITGEKLQSLFSNARLFVLPSKFEGLPIVLLEALSYGIAVLASDIESHLELNLGENNYFQQGNIEDLKKKLNYFMTTTVTEKEKLRQIEMLRKNYNWDEITRRTYGVYEGLL